MMSLCLGPSPPKRQVFSNRFYPSEGTLFDFTSDFFSDALDSEYSFESYRFIFNYYRSLSEKQVLAYNLYTCATASDPPFYGECIDGANNELRGYVAGRYIDRDMIATQLEYRLALPWRFGAVVSGGLGEVAPSVGQLLGSRLAAVDLELGVLRIALDLTEPRSLLTVKEQSIFSAPRRCTPFHTLIRQTRCRAN